MNFSQLQEKVRLELLRRIERGTLSVSLLARLTKLGQGHISNFLHGRRQVSMGTLDRILAAQRLTVTDLLPAQRGMLLEEQQAEVAKIPLVSHAAAISQPYLQASSVLMSLPFPASLVTGLEERCPHGRLQWERFVAVQITAEDARGMEPVLLPDGLVILDRHYTSFRPYRDGAAMLYGARVQSKLVVRYAQFEARRVVLRAHQAQMRAEVIEVGAGESEFDSLVGRVVVVVNVW
jgi:transcriptional regulator with XRE-family HTH domain